MRAHHKTLSELELRDLQNRMPTLHTLDDLAFDLEAAGHGVRLRIVLLLIALGSLSVADLANILELAPMEVADHLAHLSRADMVRRQDQESGLLYGPGEHQILLWLRVALERERNLLNG